MQEYIVNKLYNNSYINTNSVYIKLHDESINKEYMEYYAKYRANKLN